MDKRLILEIVGGAALFFLGLLLGVMAEGDGGGGDWGE